MYIEFYCNECKSPDNIRIETRKETSSDSLEIWLVCKCGDEHYLGDNGDKI